MFIFQYAFLAFALSIALLTFWLLYIKSDFLSFILYFIVK